MCKHNQLKSVCLYFSLCLCLSEFPGWWPADLWPQPGPILPLGRQQEPGHFLLVFVKVLAHRLHPWRSVLFMFPPPPIILPITLLVSFLQSLQLFSKTSVTDILAHTQEGLEMPTLTPKGISIKAFQVVVGRMPPATHYLGKAPFRPALHHLRWPQWGRAGYHCIRSFTNTPWLVPCALPCTLGSHL